MDKGDVQLWTPRFWQSAWVLYGVILIVHKYTGGRRTVPLVGVPFPPFSPCLPRQHAPHPPRLGRRRLPEGREGGLPSCHRLPDKLHLGPGRRRGGIRRNGADGGADYSLEHDIGCIPWWCW